MAVGVTMMKSRVDVDHAVSGQGQCSRVGSGPKPTVVGSGCCIGEGLGWAAGTKQS
jgi:hypothetical protein